MPLTNHGPASTEGRQGTVSQQGHMAVQPSSPQATWGQGLCPAHPYLFVPLEVRRDGQLHLQGGARDGLQMHRQLQLGEQVDVLVDGLAHLRHTDELA